MQGEAPAGVKGVRRAPGEERCHECSRSYAGYGPGSSHHLELLLALNVFRFYTVVIYQVRPANENATNHVPAVFSHQRAIFSESAKDSWSLTTPKG